MALLLSLACSRQSLDADSSPPDKGLSVAKARSYFGKYDGFFSAATKSAADDSLLSPGWFEVNWNNAVTSVAGDVSAVEVGISPSKFFGGAFVNGMVPVKQRLLILQRDTVLTPYITTIVPSVGYYAKWPNYDSRFVHLSDGDFSGYLLFHTICGGFVQAAHLEDGQIVDSYFEGLVSDKNMVEVERGVHRVLGELKIYRTSISTRCYDGGDIEGVICTATKKRCQKCWLPIWECYCLTPDWDCTSNQEMSKPPLIVGGGGGGTSNPPPPPNPKPEPKKPCNDGATASQANPLASMLPSPSSEGNDKGGMFGLTRWRKNLETGELERKNHWGLDLAAEPGTPVYSMFGGKVVDVITQQPNREGNSDKYPDGYSGDRGDAGNMVTIESVINGVTVTVTYMHLYENDPYDPNKPTGGFTNADKGRDDVKRGDLIGHTGRTGNANQGYTNHLHIGVKENGKSVDPQKYLNATFQVEGRKVTVTTPCD